MGERPGDGRRYSEREFALILRTASELQTAEDGAAGRPEGLSLREIEQIAQEAGIDANLVARAAVLVDRGAAGAAAGGLFGPSGRVHLSTSLDGELSTDELAMLMQVVRYHVRQPGSVHEVLGSVAWKSDSSENALEIRITPRQGRTHIEILGDHKAAKVLFYVLGAVTGFLGLIIALPLFGLPKAAVLLAGFALGPVLGLLGSRPLWSSYAKRLRARLGDLMGILEGEASREALPRPEDPTVERPPS